jgi:hypothetical protein
VGSQVVDLAGGSTYHDHHHGRGQYEHADQQERRPEAPSEPAPFEPRDKRRRHGSHDRSRDDRRDDRLRQREDPDGTNHGQRDADREPRRGAEVLQPPRCSEEPGQILGLEFDGLGGVVGPLWASHPRAAHRSSLVILARSERGGRPRQSRCVPGSCEDFGLLARFPPRYRTGRHMGAKVERAMKRAAKLQQKQLDADTAEIERDAASARGGSSHFL